MLWFVGYGFGFVVVCSSAALGLLLEVVSGFTRSFWVIMYRCFMLFGFDDCIWVWCRVA